jgi:uncharacterized protein (TIGR02588 family)
VTERRERNAAEWVTLAASCLVLLVVVLLVAVQLVSDRYPAAPVATIDGPPHIEAGAHHVDVVVRNDGDETAANVQITATLTIDGEDHDADQVIDFLAGGEEEELVFVFEDDPADGELSVEVAGFAVP